jgi:hypothetical protein
MNNTHLIVTDNTDKVLFIIAKGEPMDQTLLDSIKNGLSDEYSVDAEDIKLTYIGGLNDGHCFKFDADDIEGESIYLTPTWLY